MSSRFPNSRTDAAKELLASGKIRIDGADIVVPSSDGRREYRVRLIGGRPACQCEDYRRGNHCKHLRAAEQFAEQSREMSKV